MKVPLFLSSIFLLNVDDSPVMTRLEGINLIFERVPDSVKGAASLFTLRRVLRRGQKGGVRFTPLV